LAHGTLSVGSIALAGLRHDVAVLPFELLVLEVALGDVCHLCTELVKELEAVSNPALDALTNYVRVLSPYSGCSVPSEVPAAMQSRAPEH
jgi:hypothetical protein